MADVKFTSPIPAGELSGANLSITDETNTPKLRVVGDNLRDVAPGRALRDGATVVYSTSPNEWTMLEGDSPDGMRSIDLTHVRAIIRLSGSDSLGLLAKVCALDFGDRMFPAGSAARTSVAGTATEIVRDDQDGVQSYLLVTSRSFADYLFHVLKDQAQEFLY